MDLARTHTSTLSPTDLWPAFTTHSAADVVIAAVSISRLVDWCGTPCVHTADAVVPNSGGRPSESDLASVLITRVVSAEWRSDLRLHVQIDADLSGCDPQLSQARLIGRVPTGEPAAVLLSSSTDARNTHPTMLPGDLAVGDLVVIPCAGVTLLHSVKVARAL
jgi:hypothetical protein